MSAPGHDPTSGPLTSADLQAVWESAVDPLYAQPLIEKGDGGGFEAFGQTFEQLSRVSRAVDVTTQSMFILPWSGQTSDPARGQARATAAVSFSRTRLLDQPMVVGTSVMVVEETTDWGPMPGDAAQVVRTGRRYALTAPLAFVPGTGDPISGTVVAEAPGWGYNNPLPGTLSAVEQPGVNFENSGASVEVPGAGAAAVVAAPNADVFVPEHVGQYLVMTGGTNVGKVVRTVGYVGSAGADGGRLLVARDLAFEGTPTGSFVAGEVVRQAVTLAEGRLLAAAGTFLLVEWGSGTFNGANVVTGLTSLATFTPTSIVKDSGLSAEAGTASWRALSWADDWGLATTNPASPTGGRLGYLDELVGRERKVPRGPGETDDAYRARGSKVADVVSPNAISRAANRKLAPFGVQGCFREAGLATLPGFYLDGPDWWDEASVSFTFDPAVFGGPMQQGERVRQLDPTNGQVAVGRVILGYNAAGSLVQKVRGIAVESGTFQDNLFIVGDVSGGSFSPAVGTTVQGATPALRYRYLFDFLEMRAFFVVAVPTMNLGEFGFAWDSYPFGFYDASPYGAFFDGYATGAAALLVQLWQELDRVKAGGVGFDLVLDEGACP